MTLHIKISFEDCLKHLQVEKGQTRGFISVVRSEDPEDPGWNILFVVKNNIVVKISAWAVDTIECWTECSELNDGHRPRDLLEFMKNNAEPREISVGSAFDSLPRDDLSAPKTKKVGKDESTVDYVVVYKDHLRLSAADGWCTWYIYDTFAVGTEYWGHKWLVLEKGDINITWYNPSTRFSFSFDNVVNWLVQHQVPIRRVEDVEE